MAAVARARGGPAADGRRGRGARWAARRAPRPARERRRASSRSSRRRAGWRSRVERGLLRLAVPPENASVSIAALSFAWSSALSGRLGALDDRAQFVDRSSRCGRRPRPGFVVGGSWFALASARESPARADSPSTSLTGRVRPHGRRVVAAARRAARARSSSRRDSTCRESAPDRRRSRGSRSGGRRAAASPPADAPPCARARARPDAGPRPTAGSETACCRRGSGDCAAAPSADQPMKRSRGPRCRGAERPREARHRPARGADQILQVLADRLLIARGSDTARAGC